MGIPLTASIINATDPVVNTYPQGLYLSADSKRSIDTDSSFFDIDPERHNNPPLSYSCSAYLGRMSSWNNEFPDRGALYPGFNEFPNRSTATEEVRMGDFLNYTNTVVTASSLYSVPSPSLALASSATGSIKKTDFHKSLRSLRKGVNNQIHFTLYLLGTSNPNNNYPQIYALWKSGSFAGINSIEPYTTGSNYSFESFYTATSSFVSTESVYTIAMDDGTVDDSMFNIYQNLESRTGIFYYTQANYPYGATYGVPYEITMSSAWTPVLTVHSDKKYTLVSSVYGNHIVSAASLGSSVPPIIGNVSLGIDDMVHSSVAFYKGYLGTGLYAKLTTLSGSILENTPITAYTGSQFTITPSSSYLNASYVSTCIDSNLNNVNYITTVFGEIPSGNTDLTCSISIITPKSGLNPTPYTSFLSNPSNYLDLTGSYVSYQPLLTDSGGYGTKAIDCNLSSNYHGIRYKLLATTRGDNTLDLHIINTTASSGIWSNYIIKSVENLGYDPFTSQGYIDYTSPISLSYIGSYLNYSASLSAYSATKEAVNEYYFFLSCTRTDGYSVVYTVKVIPPQQITDSPTSYTGCEMYVNTPNSKVVRNHSLTYKDFGGSNINALTIVPKTQLPYTQIAGAGDSLFPTFNRVVYPSSSFDQFNERSNIYTSPVFMTYGTPGISTSSLYMKDISLF